MAGGAGDLAWRHGVRGRRDALAAVLRSDSNRFPAERRLSRGARRARPAPATCVEIGRSRAACGRGQRKRRPDGWRVHTTVWKRQSSEAAQQRTAPAERGLAQSGAAQGAHIAVGARPRDTAAPERTAPD
ncbi:hypothetical protein NDU88_004524 [Pleurodeles waltl]|uniref:Uncharacterized protein n=1 Tax=Pleurodeles waltl TaxID=8319 RepID=A0AAV7LPJ1_PLEWA|nr:hypothetical protein NDU88_004524 [Pleurodeles waltl]